jgi:hypothetical protein
VYKHPSQQLYYKPINSKRGGKLSTEELKLMGYIINPGLNLTDNENVQETGGGKLIEQTYKDDHHHRKSAACTKLVGCNLRRNHHRCQIGQIG